MQRTLAELEEYSCALMNYSGVSWDAMATYYGVSRQALHRRLASGANNSFEQAQQDSRLNHDELVISLEIIDLAVEHLEVLLDQELSGTVQTWQERRKTAGWWRENLR